VFALVQCSLLSDASSRKVAFALKTVHVSN
jgi:hypothetical protein